MDTSDEDLFARYRKGDTAALGTLVERYWRPLHGFISRMAPTPQDADDVFQEVWSRVIRKAHGYRRERFRGWVFRISHNLLIDRARCRKPMVSMDEEPREGAPLPLGERLASGGLGPHERVAGHDIGKRLDEALDKLPEEQREVFVLRMQADMSFREIAKAQGVSINTALARMQYAIQNLRRELKQDYAMLRSES